MRFGEVSLASYESPRSATRRDGTAVDSRVNHLRVRLGVELIRTSEHQLKLTHEASYVIASTQNFWTGCSTPAIPHISKRCQCLACEPLYSQPSSHAPSVTFGVTVSFSVFGLTDRAPRPFGACFTVHQVLGRHFTIIEGLRARISMLTAYANEGQTR